MKQPPSEIRRRRQPGAWPTMLLLAVFVAAGCTGRPSQPPEPPETPAPTVAVADEEPGPDLFGPLRTSAGNPAIGDRWSKLADTLTHLKTLEGAYFDEGSGELLLYGEPSDEPGPLRLEDLVVALWAQFHQLHDLSMTIDPVPDDKNGPLMDVKFFGGSQDTHFGQVMFECDRLMKCLSLGQDNLTHDPVASQVEEFYPLTDLSLGLNKAGGGPAWARFWIVSALERFADDDSRGKPVLEVTDGGRTAWFRHWQMYVQTEQMRDLGKGEDLVSAEGEENPAAKRFADHFTAKYDEIGAEYPVFRDLKEVTKLVALADWIDHYHLPIDHELLYLRFPAGEYDCPATTPTLSVSREAQEGQVIHTVTLLGGVSTRPRTFFAEDTEGHAEQFAQQVKPYVPEVVRTGFARIEPAPGQKKQIVGIPNSTRGPPAESGRAGKPPRAALRVVESSGDVEPSGRTSHAVRLLTDTTRLNRPLGDYDLPVWSDPATGHDHLNLPVLRIGNHARQIKKVEFTLGSEKYTVRVPDYLHLTSPRGDVNVRFKTEPEFDREAEEPYFPAERAGVKGYYPQSSSVVLEDGTQYRFDPETGLIASVSGGGRPSVEFSHPIYRDGALAFQEPEDPNLRPRPPPEEGETRRKLVVRPSQGEPTATSRVEPGQKMPDAAALEPVRPEPQSQSADGAPVGPGTSAAQASEDPNLKPRPPPETAEATRSKLAVGPAGETATATARAGRQQVRLDLAAFGPVQTVVKSSESGESILVRPQNGTLVFFHEATDR